MISTPCPLCQQNVEMYQARINKEFGDSFNIPIVFYSQIMAVAFGHGREEGRGAGLQYDQAGEADR